MPSLFPKTRLGTWVLAAAMWAGCCALGWELLPGVPRAEWTDVPRRTRLGHILPAGPTVIADIMTPYWDSPRLLAGIWDASSGRQRLVPAISNETVVGHSRDWHWTVVSRDGGFQVCQAGDPSRDLRLPCPPGRPADEVRCLFAPNSSVLAFADGDAVQVVSVTTLKPVGRVHGAAEPLSFSADGRCITCRTPRGDCVVADLPAGKVRFRRPVSDAAECLSPSGDRLFDFEVGSHGRGRAVGWNVGTGQQTCVVPIGSRWQAPGDQHRVFTVDTNTLPGGTSYGGTVSVYDADGGLLCRQAKLDDLDEVLPHDWASANGRILVVDHQARHLVGEWLGRWAPWLGLRSEPTSIKVMDVVTSGIVCRLPADPWHVDAIIASDGSAVAVRTEQELRVWDIPPRKPLVWFLALSAILFFPAALLARWRLRRLHRGEAFGGT